jgi:hypothetical protein
MKRIKKGFIQAIVSIITGILLTWVITFLVNKTVIPGYSIIIFTTLSLIANIISINKMGRWGLFYTIGWLVGTLLFKEMLSTTSFILNVIFPVLILIIRATEKIRQLAH